MSDHNIPSQHNQHNQHNQQQSPPGTATTAQPTQAAHKAFVFQDCASSQDELSYQAGSEASSVGQLLNSSNNNNINNHHQKSSSKGNNTHTNKSQPVLRYSPLSRYAPPAIGIDDALQQQVGTRRNSNSSKKRHQHQHQQRAYPLHSRTNTSTTNTTSSSHYSSSNSTPHSITHLSSPSSLSGDISSVTSASVTSYSESSTDFSSSTNNSSSLLLATTRSQSFLTTTTTTTTTAQNLKNKNKLGEHLKRHNNRTNNNNSYSNFNNSNLSSTPTSNTSNNKKGRKNKYSKMPTSSRKSNNNNAGGGDGSDADISVLTTESCIRSDHEVPSAGAVAGSGFLGRLLTSSSNNKKASTSTPQRSSISSNNKNTPLHLRDGQDSSEDDLDVNGNSSPSWALSPAIGSIPEELLEDRGSPARRGTPAAAAPSSSAHRTTPSNTPITVSSIASTPNITIAIPKEVISPPLIDLSSSLLTPLSCLNHSHHSISSSIPPPSPHSQKSVISVSSVNNRHLDDTSSVANQSVASGATGMYSEATRVVCNTKTGVGGKSASNRNKPPPSHNGIPRPLSTSSQLHRYKQQPHGQVVAPHLQYPFRESSAILEAGEEDDPYNKLSSIESTHSKRRFCSGTQGIIICVLVALFVFGLITVAVSFFLSQQDNNQVTDEVDLLQGEGLGNDDAFNSSTFDQEFDGSNVNDDNNSNASFVDDSVLTTLAPTVLPTAPIVDRTGTEIPTLKPSFVQQDENEESALFADAVGDLLDDNAPPTTNPTFQPTSAVPISAKLTVAPTNNIPQALLVSDSTSNTVAPTNNIPQALSVSDSTSNTFLKPTHTPTAKPTTTMPTTMPTTNPTIMPTTMAPTVFPTMTPPILQSDTILESEAQLMGAQTGDAAGSSIALSSNGQVMAMGSPNASPGDLQRSGQVQIFERRPKAAIRTFLRQFTTDDEEWEWTLRGIISGENDMNQLGYSVVTSDDGTFVVVSQPTADSRRGRVNIYEWEEVEQAYVERQVLTGEQTTDHFGISLSLSGDGRRLAVGSPYHSSKSKPGDSASNLRGQVQVFDYYDSSQTWELMEAEDPSLFLGSASLDWMGWAVSLSNDGQILAVGAPRNNEFGGYVQCFQWSGSAWTNMGTPILNAIAPAKLDDRFGHSVSITGTGSKPGNSGKISRVAIGSPMKDVGNVLNSGLVAIYEWTGSAWVLDVDGALGGVMTEDQPGFYHQLGYTMQMSGDAIAVGVPGWDNRRGLVQLFWLSHAFSNGADDVISWERLSNPLIGAGPGDDFGYSVGLKTQASAEEPTQPISLSVAVGAIQVNAENLEAMGYSQVFRAGSSTSV